MIVKQIRSLIILILCVISVLGCKKEISSEERVNKFVDYFIEKMEKQQIDSLKTVYPDIVTADSLSQLNLRVEPEVLKSINDPDKYTIKFGDSLILNVSINEIDDIHIDSSKGLFAYSKNKMDFAKNTGLYNDKLSDKELAERMADREFLNYLNSKATNLKKKILKIGEPDPVRMERPIINLTNSVIFADDYQVVMESYERINFEDYETSRDILKGKTIPAKGRVYFDSWGGSGGGIDVKDVIIKISPEELRNRFMEYTGNEYEEYLTTKGANK